MKYPQWSLAALGVVAALGILGAACGGDDADDKPSPTAAPAATTAPAPTATSSTPQTPGTETGAATLRAGLTALLQEHVYLAATATNAALSGGNFQAAAAALDANSVELSKAVGSVYGQAAGNAFLELWRKHIGFFVDYTQGKAAGDAAKVAKAKADLDQYRQDFGAFLASANPNLPKDAVAMELAPHVSTLFAAIDAQAAKDAKSFELLRTAASHMPHTADVLAGAIVKQMPDKFPGNEQSPAAQLRSGLTALLQEHVYLAATATNAAVTGGNFTAAAAALDANSVDLSKAVGSVYGTEAGNAFLELWRKHIGFFVAYTQGKASGDTAKVDKAKADLDAYRQDFGAFLASANPNLPKDAVAMELAPHVSTLFAVIDAQVAKDAKQYDLMRTAAGHMPHTAGVLAGAIAKQMPSKFPG